MSLVPGVWVLGTLLHNLTRGRGFVASVHVVGEVEMKALKCERERSRAKEIGIQN